VGLFTNALSSPLARLEPYGMIILIGLLFILPLIGAQIGLDLNVVCHHFFDQEVLDDLHEELRQHCEHFVWLESEGHSLSQAAAGVREKIEQLEEQIETLRATGRFP
jgi:hypothetical protein